MTVFTARFRPHGDIAAMDGLHPIDWNVEAETRENAVESSLDRIGIIVGEPDFAYRKLADGSISVMDTLFARHKIGHVSWVAAR